MKRVITLSLLTATLAFATNGDNMIGVGAQSRAMGGAGVGMVIGTDSVFRNPAWIVDLKGFNASFGATAFMPTVTATVGPMFGGNGSTTTSDADFSIIPTVSHSDHISENLSYGVGMFGVSGMGVDYRNETDMGLGNMRTSLQFMRFVPSLSYKMDDLRLGAGLTVAYGALNMAAITPSNPADPMNTSAQRSGGLSEDIGFGAQLGLGYHVTPSFTVGAYYQTQVDMTYDDVFDFDAGNMQNGYDDLDLSQPAEAGIGFGYTSSCECYSVTFEYRRIMWSDADGYDAFQWDDQDVFVLGGSYKATDALTLRAGYNYAESPLHDKTFTTATVGGVPFQPGNIAYFNALGFPAYSDSHITGGLSYQISKSTGLDVAYVYAPEVEETVDFGGGANVAATNEQNSITVALNFKF